MTTSAVPKVGDICSWMDRTYPPELAEDWDRVGLICGDRQDPVSRILLAVDLTEEVISEAAWAGAQMVLSHHPLFLFGTWTVSADTYKGRVIQQAIRSGIALFNAHTNADHAPGGVAEALGRAAGMDPSRWLPLVPRPDLGELTGLGLGRYGPLQTPRRLGELVEFLARNLPASPGGILVAGDPDEMVHKIVVSGGAGDSLLDVARATGADAFITADLRHHPAQEALDEGGPALICPTHWASEWVWLPYLLRQLSAQPFGKHLEISISEVCSEPWEYHVSTSFAPAEPA